MVYFPVIIKEINTILLNDGAVVMVDKLCSTEQHSAEQIESE